MNTIRSRLLSSMLLVGLVPLLVVVVPLATVVTRNLRIAEEERLSETARQLGRLVGEVTDRTTRELSSLQSNPLLSDPTVSLDSKLEEMNRLVKIYEVYSDISLYDTEGFLLGSTSQDHPAFREYSDWYRMARTGKTVMSPPQRVLGKDGLFLTVYLPVKGFQNADGTHGENGENGDSSREVLKARLSFARILSILTDPRVAEQNSVYLLDALGNTLSGGDPGRLMEKFDPSIAPERWITDAVGSYVAPSGKAYLYARDILSTNVTHTSSHWVVLALKPMEEVTSAIKQAFLGLLAAAGTMLLLAALLGVFLSKLISRPLENIGRVAGGVTSGNLSVRADESDGSNEIRSLAGAFNRMVGEIADHRESLERLVASRTESLHRSQAELERAGARLQAAVGSTNNGFLVEDADGAIAVVNERFLDALGFESASEIENGDEILFAFAERGGIDEKKAEIWRGDRESGGTIDEEITLARPERRVLHVYSAPIRDPRGNLVGRVWSTQDLTAHRELEEGLRQSQKMEAVGQLAGGIAHDFNNLLAGILGNLALVKMELGDMAADEARESLGHAVKAGERAAELVKQLLGFSRRSRLDLKPCDANLVLAEVRDILSATIDRRIRVDLELESSPWRVMADVGMLGQVIMNMAVNAKDAMPGGGRLILRSGNRTLSQSDLRAHPEVDPGDFVCLSVEDEGEGIPLSVQAKIFEPFFTTKEPGKGTGLGLATSFGIVKQLGGWIDFHSVPDEGTRFDIYLPRSTAAEAGNSSALLQATASGGLAASRSGEAILLVDDEALVRRIGRTLLTKLGYEVVEAQDGLEAIEICEARGDSISLVLLDLTMPKLTGGETFARLHEMRPELPVLICSGYLVDLNEFTRECGASPEGFVQKPYSFEDMADMIRRTLDSRSHAA